MVVGKRDLPAKLQQLAPQSIIWAISVNLFINATFILVFFFIYSVPLIVFFYYSILLLLNYYFFNLKF